MPIIIDGKALSAKVTNSLKIECEELKNNGIIPKLEIISVGNNEASKIYIKNKRKVFEQVGIECEENLLNSNIKQEKLINIIKKFNEDKSVNGILLQSPIPDNLNINEAFITILPEKDVDGFNPLNLGKLVLNQDSFVPCTTYGIMHIFEEYNINLECKNVVILGRSNIVGKPLAACCINKNATVTICHSKTQKIEEKIKDADILISATGKAHFITKDMIKKNAVVIDVGISRLSSGKIVGDVDFEQVKEKASYITPVPGGVGPMTVAMLAYNVIKAAKRQNNIIY